MTNGCEIPIYKSTEEQIKSILTRYKNIAIVGISSKKSRASYSVAKFLMESGYKIFPVNPNYENVLELKCYKSLKDIKDNVEIVNIFRKSEEVKPIVEEAIQIAAKVVWLQEGVINNEAGELALKAGLEVVMNKCIMAELKKIYHQQKNF